MPEHSGSYIYLNLFFKNFLSDFLNLFLWLFLFLWYICILLAEKSSTTVSGLKNEDQIF